MSEQTSQTRANPYIGPRSFRTGETLYGREHELRDLMGLLIAERIVLLHSPSGAGKTSLVQAALIPALREQGFEVLPPMRVSLEPEDGLPDGANRYLLSLLLSLEEMLPPEQQLATSRLAGLSLADYLDQRPLADQVLIFDQFEEILTADPTDHAGRLAFFTQVGEALRERERERRRRERPSPRRWALFSMREEYVAALAPYVRLIPTRLDTTFRLDLLGPAAAIQAMREPARRAGIVFEEAAATRLSDDLRRVYIQRPDGSTVEEPGLSIEPVQLQVVCWRLWEQLDPPADAIKLADVEALGSVDHALADYYAGHVAHVAAEMGERERRIREWFERELITPQGIRGQVLQGATRSNGLANSTIRSLINAYLVRAEERRGATWFELAHDRLIEPVRSDNAAWFEANLSPLQRRADLWEIQGRPDSLLFRGSELDEAELWAQANQDMLTQGERDFLMRCRELRRSMRRERLANLLIRGFAVIIAIATLIIGLLYFQVNVARDKAEQQYRLALARQLIAQSIDALAGPLDLALLLSSAANDVRDSLESRGSLLRALTTSPALVAYLRGSGEPVNGLTILSGGRTAAAIACAPVPGCPESEIHFWDLTTRQPISEPLTSPQDKPRTLAASPNEALFATGGTDGTVMLWDSTTRTQYGAILSGHTGAVYALAFSPDGRLLASGGQDGLVQIWDVAEGTLRTTISTDFVAFEDAEYGVRTLAFSPDGMRLAGGGCGELDEYTAQCIQGEVRIWQAGTWQPLEALYSSAANQFAIAFSPDGRLLATGNERGTLQLWDSATGQPIGDPLRGHNGAVLNIAFSPDSSMLASASQDRRIIIWDVADRRQAAPALTGHSQAVYAVAFAADGHTLLSGGKDGNLILWDLTYSPRIATPIATDTPIGAVAFSPDGTTLAAGSDAGAVAFYTMPGMQLRNEPVVAHSDVVNDIAFSPDGATLASAGYDGAVFFWDTASAQPRGEPLRLANPALRLTYSPDGAMLAVAEVADDGRVGLWRTSDGQPVAVLTPPAGSGYTWSLAFSPDGQTLVTGQLNGDLLFWEVATGKLSDRNERAHQRAVLRIVFSPDGRLLASAGSDFAINLWNATDHTLINPLPRNHSDSINALAFAPDGQLLASGSRDGQVILWDMVDQRLFGTPLQGHNDEIYSVAFSPDGRLLASSSDSSLILWDLDNANWRTRACALAGREMTRNEWNNYLTGEQFRSVCPAQ